MATALERDAAERDRIERMKESCEVIARLLEGEEVTRDWLEGLAENGTVYDGNDVVLESVNSGEIDAGIAYHYYWYRDREESGSDSDSSALHFFGDQDPGAFLSVSGAGILKSSEHAEAAEQASSTPARC